MPLHPEISGLEKGVNFIFAVLILAGMYFQLTQMSLGLASLPVVWIRGQKSLEQNDEDLMEQLNQVQDEIRQLAERYPTRSGVSPTRLSSDDARTLRALEREERSIFLSI
jgi:hypothetical protein